MILVSVYVATYNHKDYIRQALDSIVCQKTNFKFEIIVHDDASTDGTAEIVKEYHKKYPQLIVPILQKENQHQLNVNKLTKFILPTAKGKYIAFNEGDDFWTDEYKLQKQVNYIENNDGCAMVVHRTNKVSEDGSFLKTMESSVVEGNYTLQDILSNSMSFSTNSMLIRTSVFKDNITILNKVLGYDYLVKTLAVLNGRVYILSDNMSCYRVMSKGSWTERVGSSSTELAIFFLNSVKTFEILCNDSRYKHYHSLREALAKKKFLVHYHRQEYENILKNPNLKKIYYQTNFKMKCKILLGYYFPFFLHIILFFKKKYKYD